MVRSPLTPAVPDKNTIEFASTLLRHLGSIVIVDTNKKDIAGVADNPVILELFKRMLLGLSRGKAVSIVPHNAELTTHQAANLLNVSRPHFVKMLEQGKIAYHRAGTHRRVLFQDLINYKKTQKADTQQALKSLMELSEDYGLY